MTKDDNLGWPDGFFNTLGKLHGRRAGIRKRPVLHRKVYVRKATFDASG
jgi:hypothetical protein